MSTATLQSYQSKLKASLTKLHPSEVTEAFRYLCRTDLYFLLRYGLNRQDLERQWLFDRCREVQNAPNGHIDLWAREHYKSTIITFAKSIQDILASHGKNPLPVWGGREITIGIFSHTRPIAKGFMRQIKYELESNERLREWFPDVVWENPQRDAPKWSEDDGIIVKRKSNPKEATLEAWGLVDGQPTGKHFFIRVYDDVVTRESVTTPDMINKTTAAWELSTNLGCDGGHERIIGTRYHFNDTYREIIKRGVAKARIYPATADGKPEGEPILLSREALTDKRRKQGPYTFACQMLQNPVADQSQGFKRDWLKFYNGSDGGGMNIYILVDPASEKKKTSDYTVMWVVGLGSDQNYYHLDLVRDRLNLTERGKTLMRLHRKWRPQRVGYEKYGMQADIEFIKTLQDKENYRFEVVELGGSMPKNDRIRRMIPVFESGRFYLKYSQHVTNYEGRTVDLIQEFENDEYLAFPVSIHDDMLDCLARITDEDMSVIWPEAEEAQERYSRDRKTSRSNAWAM